ncbi:PspC domain-containing protein [Pseudocolwellia agarivorans]|uniref:PspC domain-containing protein n=1 Tax=Pseudocolwellia agarivorans TaxID=1911682 RepID=UPI000984DA0D|nr:PspC domain-containing protein [Pseudocolwellia agarivorans]
MKYEQEYLIKRTLYKDNVHKKLSGVCGGLARYYGLPRFGVRLAAVVSMFVFPVVVGVAYVVAALLIPNR